jgi:hypothetical protein
VGTQLGDWLFVTQWASRLGWALLPICSAEQN